MMGWTPSMGMYFGLLVAKTEAPGRQTILLPTTDGDRTDPERNKNLYS